MDNRGSSKRETNKFHSNEVALPSKESISHKNKGKRIRRCRSLGLSKEKTSTSSDLDNSKEILKVTACHAVSIVEVDNNYASSEEVDNSNEIKQRTSIFDLSSLQLLDLQSFKN